MAQADQSDWHYATLYRRLDCTSIDWSFLYDRLIQVRSCSSRQVNSNNSQSHLCFSKRARTRYWFKVQSFAVRAFLRYVSPQSLFLNGSVVWGGGKFKSSSHPPFSIPCRVGSLTFLGFVLNNTLRGGILHCKRYGDDICQLGGTGGGRVVCLQVGRFVSFQYSLSCASYRRTNKSTNFQCTSPDICHRLTPLFWPFWTLSRFLSLRKSLDAF